MIKNLLIHVIIYEKYNKNQTFVKNELGKKKKLRTEITMNKMNQEFLKILSGKHKKHRHRAYLCRC